MPNEFIPYPMSGTDAPIDISFAFGNEKPAGKHGFLKVKGDHFEFEDGTPGRFWGVCINASANFPEHAHAERLAKRLAKMGVNIVRTHQLDAEYCVPNIFQYSRGPLLKSNRKFDPVSLERFDYLIHCLRKEGIYIYLDNMVSRLFREADGVVKARELGRKACPAALFNRTLIDLQKEYITNLWTHVNPYTGLAYADDPAVVMTECINEGTLFASKLIEPYLSEFTEGFKKWLEENNEDYSFEGKTMFGGKANFDGTLVRYKVEKEKAFYAELRDHLRSVGVKIPITGSNYIMHSGMFAANMDMDFCDNHAYFHRLLQPGKGTTWGEKAHQKRLESYALTSEGDSGQVKIFHMRDLNRPCTVSEWNMTWPNTYRAEGAMVYAAMAALQGIDAVCIHTYSYTAEQNSATQILGKEVFTDAIGGVPYREGIFCAWNDPAIMGLFYHAALILRRGDVDESKKRVVVVTDPTRDRERADFLQKEKEPLTEYLKSRYDRMAPCYYAMGEISKIGTALEVPAEGEADRVFTEPQWPIDMASQEACADNGQMYRTWKHNYGWIDTDMSKCVYGSLQKNGKLELDGLSVKCDTDFAVIALSSLTEDPISKADNLLLTTVGRTENTGAKMVGDLVVEWGGNPVQVEVIKADIELKTEQKDLVVYSISPEGYIQGNVPTKYEDGVLKFTVGEKWRSMYYLIQIN